MNEYDYLAKAKKNMDKEKYHEVISLCDKALKINKDLPEAYSFRGNAKYELGEYGNAAEDFSLAIEKDPNEAEYYFDRSWAYHYMDKDGDAFVDINKAIEIEPKTSLYYFDKGRFEYWAERYKEAIVSFTKGIELKPTENKYLFRGNCYMELEEFDFALSDFNSAIEIDSEFARAYYRRGLLYKRLEQLEKAENDFKKAIELCPKYDDAMIELGLVKIQLGKKDVMKYFNKAIKAYSCSDNYYWKVRARQKILARENALTKLSAGVFVQDNCDKNKIFNEKQAKDDIKDLDKAIALNPDDITLYEMRVERYRYLKDYQNAIEDYDTIIKTNPEEYFNYTMRAFCNERVGQYDKALEDCKKSVELNDGCADIIIFGTRGLANYKLGNIEKALTDFNQTLELENDTETYYYRGLTNYRLKNFKQSYKDFKKALELKPGIESDYNEKIPAPIKFVISFMDGFSRNKGTGTPIGLCQMKISND